MYKKTQFLFIFLVLFFCFSQHPGFGEENKKATKLIFHFALVYKKAETGITAINITPYSTLPGGTHLKIYLKPVKNAYIYLFHYDTGKQLSLLYPGSPDYYDEYLPMEIDFFLPDETKWYTLDEKKGIEYFYLIASTSRLLSLESLTRTYLTSIKAKSSPDKIIQSREAIINTLLEIRKKSSTLATPAERPIPITGNIRDEKKEPELIISLGTEITAGEIYGKTIRIAH